MPTAEYKPLVILYPEVVREDSAYAYQNWLKAALSPCRDRSVGIGQVPCKKLAVVAREGERMSEKETKKERRRQIKKLLGSSTPEQQQRIKAGQRTGRRLRKELEQVEQGQYE